jgi:hypothetical protein
MTDEFTGPLKKLNNEELHDVRRYRKVVKAS